MSGALKICTAGPALTLQDMGRSGYLAYGLTRGGAADTLALLEGAALLDQGAEFAAIEMVGAGGVFETNKDTVIALTGAQMAVEIDGAPALWNASHSLVRGSKIKIGGATEGTYGYLSVQGGFDVPVIMGARSAHLKGGIGKLLEAGQELPLGAASPNARSGYIIAPEPRLSGGEIRMVASMQTEHFSQETLDRFTKTTFKRDARGNRQGVRLASESGGFFAEGGLGIVSEVITEGDIQITGDGAPYVLLCECQTTGGYPRIGTVIPSDLPRVAQAPVGVPLRFRLVTLAEARSIEVKARASINSLPQQVAPLVRDPKDISDLLSYQLVSGVVSGQSEPERD